MTEERATGIILRTRPLTETSLVALWLTLEAGRISTVAKGARRAKSPFAGKLDLYYEADFSFARSPRSTLHTLREVSLRATRPELRFDLEALKAAAEATRRIEKTTEEDVPVEEIFELFRDFLTELARGPYQPALLVAFESKLLRSLGLGPQLSGNGLNAGEARALEQLVGIDWRAVRRIKLAEAQTASIRSALDRQFRDAY